VYPVVGGSQSFPAVEHELASMRVQGAGRLPYGMSQHRLREGLKARRSQSNQWAHN
jgi:hypothetical protein